MRALSFARLPPFLWRKLARLCQDIFFTFLLPYALLSPQSLRLPALPISLYWAYALSGLLPSLYLLLDAARRRQVHPFGLFLLLGSLSNAAVSFLRLDGVYFALKDASHSLMLIVACAVSVLLGHPLFEFLFYGLLSPETPQQGAALRAALARPEIKRALSLATLCVALKALLLAVISYVAARLLVTAPFGAPDFNPQVARAHAVTFPLFLLLDALFYGLALWLTARALRRLSAVWPWQAGFWEGL